MVNIKYISFPEIEHKNYIKRLSEKQIIYTTRVSEEVGKYSLDEICNSTFGKLKIISLEHFDELKNTHF